ncbi:MAG: hypothetical protein LC642_05310 [Verrucomicrobiaceae bacterium]|nr:hypothetical protein [Verrucomicrobiaceae bacterium]
MSVENHGIFTNLRSDKCACGDPKLPGKSFCRRDYFKLPRAMRNALYQSAGYVDAFRDALKFLGLEEPKAERPLTLRDVFPDRGPIRRNPYRRPFR